MIPRDGARALRAGAAAALLAIACGSGSDSPHRERVLRRLGPQDFPGVPVGFHGAVAQIGREARSVVVRPQRLPVASVLGATTTEGKIRVEIALPPSVRSFPNSAFTLSVQRLPFAERTSDEKLLKILRNTFVTSVGRGWRIERDRGDPGRAVLEYVPSRGGGAEARFNLNLEALMPSPERLESLPFRAPDGAHLELSYGLVDPGSEAPPAVRFAAALRCEGRPAHGFVEKTIRLGRDADAGWHAGRVALPPGTGACRLELTTAARGGEAPRGAVWATPCIVAPVRAGEPFDDRNVVLISLDTLRADHLSGYGYRRATSPRIDAELIAQGTAFRDTSSTFPLTDVSHLSLFTGLYPGAQPQRGRLAPDTPVRLLAELLRDAGFETAAYTENALVSGSLGFWFGFDRYAELADRLEDRGRATIEAGIGYLRAHRDRKFFLFLHTYKTHDPYVSSESYASLFGDPSEWEEGALVPAQHRPKVDAYDRSIREADDLVGEVLDALAELGLAERTIVVLLSDHGEAFGEHGHVGHGFAAHREQLGVPLVLRGPGIPVGVRVDAPVSLVDVAPTLLDLLGLEPPEGIQGISLAPALRGEALAPDRAIFFSWLHQDAIGVRRGRWKYLRTPRGPSLFDLAEDPRERRTLRPAARERPLDERLLADHDRASRRLREKLMAGGAGAAAAPPITEETERSLRAMGYLD